MMAVPSSLVTVARKSIKHSPGPGGAECWRVIQMKDDRRRRQAQHRKAREAQANVDRAKANEKAKLRKLEEAKDHLEHTKYLADKAERQAEGHLVRIRTGYAEGTKLFFEMFKTQATLTTGS